jgi:DNA (cytosine-5)-methyltransferase 1
MENVSGLTVGYAKQLLDDSISRIIASCYEVVLPYKVLDAKDYGIPQSRKRLFLLGCRNDQKLAQYPAGICISVNVNDATGDLPNIDDFDELLTSDCVKFNVTPLLAYSKRLHGELVDFEDFS